jgi:hypothetical protein
VWKGACFSEVLEMRGVEGSMFFRSLRDERCGVHISYGNLFKDTL